jgi:hypothetical protein
VTWARRLLCDMPCCIGIKGVCAATYLTGLPTAAQAILRGYVTCAARMVEMNMAGRVLSLHAHRHDDEGR